MRGAICRTFLFLAPLILAIGASGCGERTVEVTGRVTYNKSPLQKPGGKIVFLGASGNQSMASIGEDGTYRAANVSVGANRVAVYYTNPAAGAKLLPMPGKKGKAPASARPFLTPAKYASVDASNLSVQVDNGTVFDPELTGPKIP